MAKQTVPVVYLGGVDPENVQVNHLYTISRHNFPFLVGNLGQPRVWVGGYQIKDDGVVNIFVNNPAVIACGRRTVLFMAFSRRKNSKVVTDIEVVGITSANLSLFLREGSVNGLASFVHEHLSFAAFLQKSVWSQK
ncbi:MAG: hypothetical protein RIT04_458 [Candidatus Parcubacteria bacterium]|jgi:hypothetical protein